MNYGTHSAHEHSEQQRERLSAYLDGELNVDELAALEAQLAECSECRQELAELRQMRSLLRAMPAPSLPRTFALPLDDPEPITTLRHAHEPRSITAQRRLARVAEWLGSAAAVAGLALLVGSAVHLHSPAYSAAGASVAAPRTTYQQQEPAKGGSGSGAAARPSLEQNTPHTSAPESPTATTVSPTPTPTPPESASEAQQAVPALPLAGAGLAVGGVALFVTGKTVERRRRS